MYLIRHGQYFDSARTAEEMKLTALGREQVAYTGRRLNDLKIHFDRLIHSGMVRALESATIINEQLDSKLQLFEDKNLTEGLPVAPIPYAGISQKDVDVRIKNNNSPFHEILFSYTVIEYELIPHLQRIFIEHMLIKPKKHMIFSSFMAISYVISYASKISRRSSIEYFHWNRLDLCSFRFKPGYE